LSGNRRQSYGQIVPWQFLGKLAAAAFIAACVALGVGPDWWAKEILAVQPVWYLRAGLVLLAVVTAAALVGPLIKRTIQPHKAETEAAIAPARDDIPDVRIADDPGVRSLFESVERDKLLPLLAAGKITAWGRRGNGFPPLSAIPADHWRTHLLEYHPAPDGGINQTFLKVKARPYESEYYDVHLNREQLRRVWHDQLYFVPLLEAARIVFDQTKDSISAGMARAAGDNEAALRWYCNMLIGVRGDGVTRLMDLSGTCPPSRVQERIAYDRPPPHLEIRNGAAVLVDLPSRRVVADNLMVPVSSIPGAVSFISGLDGAVRGVPPNAVVNAS
jgi:hypothetical protein